MIASIRKVDSYAIINKTHVDVSKIIAIEDKESIATNKNQKYPTFRIYFDNAIWNVFIEDYNDLYFAWRKILD